MADLDVLNAIIAPEAEAMGLALVRVAFVSQGRAKRIPDALRQATLADAREAEATGQTSR